MLKSHPEDTLIIRYEDLIEGPKALERLVQFTGVTPKLKPWFVYEVTRFKKMVQPGPRTFYAGGDNAAWRSDPDWTDCLQGVSKIDFSEFGYEVW
jgi:hypothetical protein